MPKAAREFVIGNRKVLAGEEFEIPAGEENEYRENGLIEGEGPSGAAPEAAPAAVVTPVEPVEPEPPADGDDADGRARKRR